MDREDIGQRRSSRRDVVGVLFRRKWVIIAIFLSTVIPVTIYSLTIPPMYEANSSLLVKPGRENIYVSPVGSPEGTHPPTIIQRVAEVINSEIQIIKSRVLIARVLEEMGIATVFPPGLPGNVVAGAAGRWIPSKLAEGIGIAGMFPPRSPLAVQAREPIPLDIAVSNALKNLSVERVKNTDVIEVTFRSHDPDIPAEFIATLLDSYLERHLEVHQSARSFDFFKNQSLQLEQKLRTATTRLADFKKKYGLVAFNEMKRLTLERYTEADWATKKNEMDIVASQKRVNKLKEDLVGMSEHKYAQQSEVTDSAVTSGLKQRLADLELEKLELMQKYKPDNQKVASIDELIARAKEMLAAEEEDFHGSVSTGLNATYQTLEAECALEEVRLEELKSRQVELEKQLVGNGQKLERLGLLEPELRALERAIGVHEQNYKLYLTKFEESRVSDAMDAARMVSVNVLEPPRPPLGPTGANKAVNILVSICLGGMASLGMAFLIEYFDQTYKVPEDIKDNLALPLLGAIRDLPRKERDEPKAVAIAPKPRTYYQVLKSNVVRRADEKGTKVLSICSPTSKEGASTAAINLAAALVKDNNCRVVLVDANLRTPLLHRSFDLPERPGLSEVIEEGADLRDSIKESVIPNLFVLTSGTSCSNPAAIFESPKMVDVIDVLTEEFDWVILDCAPVRLFPDLSMLVHRLKRALGVVLVVQAEKKHMDIAIQAKEHLQEAGAMVLGAVLNRQRYVIPEMVYRRL